MKSVDCVIVGGGMVGAASALSLAQLGLKVLLVEKSDRPSFDQSNAVDLRVSAISIASQNLLAQLGAWQLIQSTRVAPYKRLGVWESGLSYTEFNAQSIDQTCLGHIVENHLIQFSLWQEVLKERNIEVRCNASVERLQLSDGFNKSTQIEIDGEMVETKVIVAADGSQSSIRSMAGIGISGWQYQQAAMLIHVETEKPQQDITWQQFTPTGPVAMLPLPGNQASLVWYHDKKEVIRLSQLSNEALTEQVNNTFPDKLGKVSVIKKAMFPLARRHANQYVKNQVVLVGDAAHSINPLAGQGVNLGFKDVQALRNVIASAIGQGEDWFTADILNRYEKERRTDNALMMTAMDALYKGFSNELPLAKLLRNAGLFAAQRVPYLKEKALAYACGLS